MGAQIAEWPPSARTVTPVAPDDTGADADVLLAGPWQRGLMAIRLARRRGWWLVSRELEQLVDAVLRQFPQPPSRAELIIVLSGPVSLLDPRAELSALHDLLDLGAAELAWFADVQQRGRRSPAALQHYRWRTIPKRDGVRVVAAPQPRLKEIQRRLLRHVLREIALHEAAHGCVPRRSVATAVAPHVGRRVLIRMDLESFFPSISAGRVAGLLRALGMPEPLVEQVAALCTTAIPVRVWAAVPRPSDPDRLPAHRRLGVLLRARHIAQGAPTSAALANAVSFRLDRRLSALAEQFGAAYTRYVDDLTFSGDGLLHRHGQGLIEHVGAIALDEGFVPAYRKTTVLGRGNRQSVLGAVVNDHATVARRERDRLRAIVHNCELHGRASQARGRPGFEAELVGRIAALGALDPVRAARLREGWHRSS